MLQEATPEGDEGADSRDQEFSAGNDKKQEPLQEDRGEEAPDMARLEIERVREEDEEILEGRLNLTKNKRKSI